MKKILSMGGVAVCALASAASAQQNYPSRPVRWVVPFAPGGPTDIMSRAIGEKLGQRLGQQFVVDNRGGAGGNIGAEIVARAPADGYTIMIGHVGTHAINLALYAKVPYDPIRDFTPISLLATLPLALVVHPSVPASNVKELIALAQKRPGELNFASAGNGGPTHLTAEVLKSLTKVNIVHVPFKGNAQALTELISGRVQMMFSNLLTSMPHARAGKLRAIAISPAKRSPQAPDLPTVAESGVAGFDVTPWYGALGPAALPPSITARLNAEITEILKAPDLRERFVAQGVDLTSSTPEQFAALIKAEVPKWRKIVQDSGAKVD
jgi:tripartite-type tricarboxylate transporter receptor subunit TctC